MKLNIKQSSWAGVQNYVPQETEDLYDIKLGKKYVIKTVEVSSKEDGEWKKKVVEILSFEITDIKENGIKIHTFQPFSDKEHNVDLLSKKQDFTIGIGNPLRLTTLTTDRGDIFIFSLID